MVNLYDAKRQVANKLATIQGVNVSASLKKGLKKIPCVIYKEIDNKPTEPTGRLIEVVYSVDIYNMTSTTSIANVVNSLLNELGLRRTACTDLEEELSHKHMKFRGIIDTKTELVYQ